MSTEILAPMPGKIVDIMVKEGDTVVEYQEVLTLEAMKMENPIASTVGGKVVEIKAKIDDQVATNDVLMLVE